LKGALAGALAGALLLLGGAAPAQEGGTFGPGLRYRNKAAGFEIALGGYAQVDYIDFVNWQSLDESQPLESPDWNLTRLRVSLEGEWRRLSWEFQGDFGDVANFTEDLEVQRRRDIWLNYRFAKAFELRAGHFKVPVGLEWLTSARRLDFIERSLPSRNLAADRDWGVAAHGEVGRLEYTAGVFQGDDSYSFRTTGTTGAGRLVVKLGDVDLGGSFAQGRVQAAEEVPGTLPQPRGQEGEAISSFEFFKRKYVDGTRRYIGGDVAFLRGPFGLKAEYLEQREERLGQGPNFEDLPAVKGRGWSASATWLVTGEKKRRTIRPDRPVFQGPGAVELGFRYDEVRYDDVGPDEGFAGVGDRSRNVRPAADRAFTGGISWWPRAFLRIVGNVVQERFEDPLLAPEPGREGNYVSVIVRFQIELP
jgi:phosphate-selective porin OprO/OprP